MQRVLRNFKRAVSIVLVLCLIFTSQAFVTFAENVGNDDETRVEEINETETTVEEIETIGDLVEESEDLVGESEDLAGASDDLAGESEDLVGAKLSEPEKENEFVGASSTSADDDIEETDYPEEPEEDETDYIEEPEEDPTIAEITESTEDESSTESFDEQETIENEQNSSGGGSETEETSIEEESEETLTIEEINDEKKDKLYGATPYTAYIYYLTYNSSDKKYEKTHATIQSDADPFLDSVNDLINQIYNGTNVPAARLQNWYVMNPSDPTTADNDAYDHFNSGSTIGNSPEALRQQIMNWYSSPTENFHIGAGFDRCTFNYMYLNIGDFTKPEERSKTYGGTQEGWGSDTLDMPLNMMKTSIGYVDGIKGWYVHNPANPNEPTEDYDPYYEGTADYNGFEDALKAAYDDWNSNTPVANNIYLGAIYDAPPVPTAYVYYMKYNDTTKKYEDKYATIESGKTDEELNTFINGLWDTTFENRLVSWFVMSPTDPSKEDLASYDHFNTKFDYDGTKEQFKEAYNNWNNGTPTENLHIGAGFSKCNFNLFYRVKYGSYDPEKTYGFGPEGQTDEQFEEFFKDIFDNAMIKDGVKGLYKLNPANPMNPTLDDYNEYYTGASVYEATLTGLKQAYDAWNDNPTEGISFGVIYTDPSAPTTYTVTYNQNLPSGYAVPTSKTWYTDSTTTDLAGSPIILNGSADMTCEDTSGNVRTLQGWNTYSSGAGSSYSFGASINTDAGFAGYTLTLYAMWSDPVAPTTGFMYWKVDGDDNNKTIHYYASPGTGRAAVVIGTNGVEHTSLGSSDREKIKYAVFEDNIAATNLKSCFENFKGLESITNLRKLDTSNVTSMRQMFMSAGVKELDLTNFDTSNVTDMYGMFSSCENLETIRVSDKFVVDKVSTSNGKFMFANCDKLEGEKGTKISDLSSPFGAAYAHIDEGSTNPGLFSSASTPPTPPTPPTPAKTVANISVKSFNATTVATSDDFSSFSVPFISNSESFDPNGMVITVTYDDSSTAEVTYNNTTASQFTITYNAPRVDIVYGGKSVIYDFSIVSEPNFYIYFNDNTNVKRAMGVYDTNFVSKIEDLYNYVSSGRELGFYVINATGLQDAYNKYNANATATMTLAEAMAEAQNITSVSPMTQYTFWGVTNRSKSQGGGTITPGGINFSGGGDDGGSSSGASDPTKGPMGDLTKSLDAIRAWLNEQINTSNDIPQSSLLKDDSLASYLKSSPENINRPYTNAQDENGNRGYGQWLRVPNTTTWYFFSGDLSQANGQSSGFLANGWYNLGWDGQEKWYYFDANGVMKIGWQVIGGKMYYLDSNLSYNWYGSRTTGTKVIDGISYSFTDKGELDTIGGNEYTNVYTNENSSNAAALQLVGNNNIDRSQFDSQFVNNTANFGNALPPFNTPGALPNQEGIHIYGGELSGPNMISRSNFEPGQE